MSSTPRIALLVCCPVVGGHEHQTVALVRDLASQVDLTVFVNKVAHRTLFSDVNVNVQVLEDRLFRPGVLPQYFMYGWLQRDVLRNAMQGFAHVIVSAGAVEASISVAVALVGRVPMTLYLPMFYDRRPFWGRYLGGVYNALLGLSCRMFDCIITINRVQSYLIRAFCGVSTVVVPNWVREVAAPTVQRAGKLVFIGRLGEQKRVDELLQWVDFESNPFREILVIGDGPRQSLVASAAHKMVHVRADLRGWLSEQDQDALLSCNDVLLLNSLIEGEPLVIREARSRGMRVVCRAIDGVRGVTKRSNRYRTVQELRSILRSLPVLVPVSEQVPMGAQKLEGTRNARNRGLKKWLQQIGPGEECVEGESM